MRYWWVNQGGTYRQEVGGGYMWSPVRNNNGAYSQYYENMRSVDPGDIVLSYVDREIRAVGVALTGAIVAPKPDEFGPAGAVWDDFGWRVEVDFRELPKAHRVRPKEHLEELLPHMPDKYSPIQRNGNGLSFYLFEMPAPFAEVLLAKVGSALEWRVAQALQDNEVALKRLGEDRVEAFLKRAPLAETVKAALVEARRGQGRFREGVSMLEPACRFTGVTTPGLLVASHIQPWHRCETNEARLDPFNGLMLTPTYDRLFDKGLVSFTADDRLLISPKLERNDIQKIRMDPNINVEPFRPKQHQYLAYHREHVFRAA